MARKQAGILLISLFLTLAVKAQQAGTINNAKSLVSALNNYRNKLAFEKLYLQTDKPYYRSGDTLWFKAYLLNGDFLTPSQRSGLLYIELDDLAGRSVKRMMIPLVSGISWGNIALFGKEISQGSYTLRAYTNWQRNFGEDYIFSKEIYISATTNATLVKTDFKLDSIGGKRNVTANLQFTTLDKNVLRLKDFQFKFINDNHTLFSEKISTGMDGKLNIKFDLTDKSQLKNLYLQARQTGKDVSDTAVLKIPVTLKIPETADIQFMPEGGHLVANIKIKVGFKAIGENGYGADINGKLIDSKNREIIKIQSTHKGMGSFEFVPQTNENYTAVINLPNHNTRNYPLPKINENGTGLSITHQGNDSLKITINATSAGAYYIIAQARGIACYVAKINVVNKLQPFERTIALGEFPTGIARFSLIDENRIPLNERIVYIDRHDLLRVNISTNKTSYTTRDSIALIIAVTDKDGKPAQGSFSMAVTDDNQVRTDSLGENMFNNLLFTADLKGTVESPGWYFYKQTSEKVAALDNLLLTQGWVGYDWKQVFDNKESVPEFQPEKEFMVMGKVTNLFNKPVKGSQVVLAGKSPLVIRDTLTDENGKFSFSGLFPVDTAEFKLEARNKNGRAFNVGIKMEGEFQSPVFKATKPISPWYINSDTLLLNNSAIQAAQLKANADYSGEGHLLKEVQIKEKKIIPHSRNLNGLGESDQTVDTQELEKAGKTSLINLLEQKIKGFGIKVKAGYTDYYIYDKRVYLVFDGIDIERFQSGNSFDEKWRSIGHVTKEELRMGHFNTGELLLRRFNFYKGYIDQYTAEDILGIEVMYNPKYDGKYSFNFTPAKDTPKLDGAYIEITTRSGNGPFATTTPGTYLYKSMAFTLAKQFYRPRYISDHKDITQITDMRSTIHWEPNIITNKNGNATISFYSADTAGNYTVIVEGVDLNGDIGLEKKKLNILRKPDISLK